MREKRFRPRAVTDRLDRRRGRRALPDRLGAGARTARRRSRARARKLADAGRDARRGCGIARGRSAARCGRSPARSRRRTGRGARQQALALTGEAGELLDALGPRGAHGCAAVARRAARGRGAQRQAARGRAARGARRPLRARSPRRSASGVAGEQITDRLVSIADPDARPIRKGKLGKPTEFGYVAQICRGDREHPPRRARADPPGRRTELGQPGREHAAARRPPPSSTGSGSDRARSRSTAASTRARPPKRSRRPRAETGVHRRPPTTRLQTHPAPAARYRTGAEGRISHLKRRYGLRRSRLKGHDGRQIWTGWAILAYNLDTLAIRTR